MVAVLDEADPLAERRVSIAEFVDGEEGGSAGVAVVSIQKVAFATLFAAAL
jgi:hypothetical protein